MNNILNKNILTILLIMILSICSLFGQELKERIILTDTKDSMYLKAKESNFDILGNYCFEIKQNDSYYFYSNLDTLGPFETIGSTNGKGYIDYTKYYNDKTNHLWYFKNHYGIKVYGKVKGELIREMDSGTKENMAITVSYNDSISFYANNELISKVNKKQVDKFGISNNEWCAFSENGNVIYYIEKDGLYSIYVNGKLIDTSYFAYHQLRINNNGQYIFAEGRKPKEKIGGYDYMFFIHTNDTILGPVRTVWNCDINENGGYYYSGNDNNTDYIIINNTLHKGLKDVSHITIIDKKTYLYSFKDNNIQKLNVNGVIYTIPYSKISYPSLDKKGNFSLFGTKDYYLYKFVNGIPILNPLSKYNVRATPLNITPEGKALVYYKTDDSTYIYEDEKILFPAFKNNVNFYYQNHDNIFVSELSREKAKLGKNVFYMGLDTVGYWIYNGRFSKPMLPLVTTYASEKYKGEVINCKLTKDGFYSIQKIGTNKYLVNINNVYFKEIDNIYTIFANSCYLTDKVFVFYGIKDKSYCQFTLIL